jgi:chlorobactene glucosyltransferase
MVSVIVPARNEAENIVSVVRSILASTYQPFELIVVDDRSTDRTTEQVRSLGSDPRLRLVLGNELPAGWFGKPWACVQGYREARGELLLFTDARTGTVEPCRRRSVYAARGTGHGSTPATLRDLLGEDRHATDLVSSGAALHTP